MLAITVMNNVGNYAYRIIGIHNTIATNTFSYRNLIADGTVPDVYIPDNNVGGLNISIVNNTGGDYPFYYTITWLSAFD